MTVSAAPDVQQPRIVAATMQDTDADARADRLRLTYSERVRHASDRDGRYPFRVSGYRIRSVGKASSRTIMLSLAERAVADHAVRPSVRYARTGGGRVVDLGGNQAVAQLFRAARAHGQQPADTPAPTPTPTPTPTPPPTPRDTDGDGVVDAQDCGARDPAIRPGAPDHEPAASELLRVTRPGGTIALASWTPDGFIGELFRTVATHVKPPVGVASPMLWGTESYLRELLGGGIESLDVVERTSTFRYRSAEEFVEFFRTWYGPTLKAFAALEDPQARRALGDDLVALAGRYDRLGSGDAIAIPATYAEAIAITADS